MKNNVIDRAAELLRTNPGLKYYEAMKQAKEEFNEVDGRAVPGVREEEKRTTSRATKSKKK